MQKTYWEAVKGRRSIYGLGNQPAVSEARIEEIMADTLKTMPSPYNSQSTRLLLLFGEAHAQLWQLTLDTLRDVTKPERFIKTEEKVKKSFASGYGTVLFF